MHRQHRQHPNQDALGCVRVVKHKQLDLEGMEHVAESDGCRHRVTAAGLMDFPKESSMSAAQQV